MDNNHDSDKLEEELPPRVSVILIVLALIVMGALVIVGGWYAVNFLASFLTVDNLGGI
jgi:hypothetical protein